MDRWIERKVSLELDGKIERVWNWTGGLSESGTGQVD